MLSSASIFSSLQASSSSSGSRSSHAQAQLSYAEEKAFARKAFSNVNASIPNLILDYLGAKESDKTKEDDSYLLIAKDMMGQNIEQTEYMQVVKNLVLDILCGSKASEYLEMKQLIATYSKMIDSRLQAAANFDEALDLLTNHFIDDPFCSGRITHLNPLNAICGDWTVTHDPIRFLQFEIFLKIQGVKVNVYDDCGGGVHEQEDKIDRKTPLHHLLLNNNQHYLTIACIKELLQHGADINIKTSQELNTPLHLAVLSMQVEAVRYLVTIPEINLLAKNKSGRSPLEEARMINSDRHPSLAEEKFEIIKILKEAIKHSHQRGATGELVKYSIKQTLHGKSQEVLHKLRDRYVGREVSKIVNEITFKSS